MSECRFCGSVRNKLFSRDRHKVAPNFGPFELSECLDCGSAFTSNPPSLEQLSNFYRSFDEHRPEYLKNAARSGALFEQFKSFSNHISRLAPSEDNFAWADVGAGGGEITQFFDQKHPGSHGIAIDIGDRAPGTYGRVAYQSIDLNETEWQTQIEKRFDFVYSCAVIEHVIDPVSFICNGLRLLNEKGRLILVCPAWDTNVRRVMGKSWPYYLPGEHLNMPSRLGAVLAAKKAIHNAGMKEFDFDIKSKHCLVAYSLRYALETVGVKWLSALVPPTFSFPVPTGIVLLSITKTESQYRL